MIKLTEMLNIKSEDETKYKVHFAIGENKKREPYEEFLMGRFDEWQAIQKRQNFNREYVISLIYYEDDTWLFAGVYKVNNPNPESIVKNSWQGWKYDLSLTNNQEDLIGRVLVKFKKEFRASYPSLEVSPTTGSKPEDIYIHSILDKKISIKDFCGFDKVNIPYLTLQYIIKNNISSWKSALSNAKGVYLIVDTLTGKQYVGSAYGKDCIWQRWTEYVKNGHGGNIELINLIKSNKADYMHNFKYSILEVCNLNLGNDYIIERETYWKEVLLTKEFGLNSN